MTIAEFKQRVRDSFGPDMEHATPANVREFLDTIARDRWREEKSARRSALDATDLPLELSQEAKLSYEDILRHFFADALAAPNEQALIQLWLLALDLAYAGLEEQAEHELGPLFVDHNP